MIASVLVFLFSSFSLFPLLTLWRARKRGFCAGQLLVKVVYFGHWRRGVGKPSGTVCLLPAYNTVPVTAESSSCEELGSDSEDPSFGQELP